ncbi:MAG: SPOR domain-containing protein [Cytophagaceae bacterium]|jgi:cell division septation protein DedD|nr:SPOR domain-containing protein [Cytophagaceae bacterium]
MAQVERRLSLHAQGGLVLFPSSELISSSDGLPDRVYGGFGPGWNAGAGFNFRIWKSFYATETWGILKAAKANFNLTSQSFRTGLRYNFFDAKRFSPFLGANYNFSFTSLVRDEYIDSAEVNSSDAFGQGFLVKKVYYNFNSLSLQNMSMHGFGATVGFEYRLQAARKKISLFGEYGIQTNVANNNNVFNQDYFYNNANFVYQTINLGVRFLFYKPEKQLLAQLNRDEWRNDKPVDVKGTLVYKNNKKLYQKELPVEIDDTLQNKITVVNSDEKGLIFMAKDLQIGDYKFMFAKRKKRIIRADLQILNYNKIDIADEELELEMVETELSENLLSRDGNFSVLLREGFQHEIMLTTTAENIMGKMDISDPRCRLRIYLKDKKDSVVSYIDTLSDDKSFNFVDIAPGQYKMQFVRMNDYCKETEFNYKFTGAVPFVSKQSNTDEPEDTTPVFSLAGKVSTDKKSGVPKGTVVKLIGRDGRVEESKVLDPKGEFEFKKLESPGYRVFVEDPSDKAKLSYAVHDRKNKEISQIQYGVGKKPSNNGPLTVKGKVITTKAQDVTKISVLLVDSSGKIRKTLPLQPDGSFSFSNLPKNKYKVVYESSDPYLRGNLRFRTEDPGLKITKVLLPDMKAVAEVKDTLHVTKDEKVIPDSADIVVNKTPNKRKDVIPPVAYKNFKPNTTYTIDGVEVKPMGYGLQIASFFVYSNLESFCKRLREKGEKNVFIQVIIKDKNNPQAGNIYRVMVGETEDKEKVLKWIPTYMDKGYDPVLRKHL